MAIAKLNPLMNDLYKSQILDPSVHKILPCIVQRLQDIDQKQYGPLSPTFDIRGIKIFNIMSISNKGYTKINL